MPIKVLTRNKNFLFLTLFNSQEHIQLLKNCQNLSTLNTAILSDKCLSVRSLNRNFIRCQSSPGQKLNGSRGGRLFKTSLKYLLMISLGAGTGILTGYGLMREQNRLEKDSDEETRWQTFHPTKYIEHKKSPYSDFPLRFHLYQYASCPYCAQIRAYLDYFGFNYHLTEVDSYSKEELAKFTRARQLPILVVSDKSLSDGRKARQFHLTNATAILSALESLRNDKYIHFHDILNQYLPILKGNVLYSTSNPFKYHVSNSDLNSIEWRKWINNQAIPVLKLNSISTFKDLFETFDYYSRESEWQLRYNAFKYVYVYYTNALKTYLEYSKLNKQISPYEKSKEPRALLHDVVNEWEECLGKCEFMSGQEKPNLADISFYGSVSAFEGCALFRESIAKHPTFKLWYERMKHEILHGFYYQKRPISSLNLSEALNSLLKTFEIDVSNKKEDEKESKVNKRAETLSKSESTLESQADMPSLLVLNNNTKDTNLMSVRDEPKKSNDLNVFRILTVTYIAHIIAFTFAAHSK